MIRRIIHFLFNKEVHNCLDEAERILAGVKEREKTPVFTTIRSFFKSNEDRDAYYRWLRAVSRSEEYRFLMFQLRETTILEMVGVTDAQKVLELNSRLNMLAIIDKYLNQEVVSYEDEIRRAEKGAEGSSLNS